MSHEKSRCFSSSWAQASQPLRVAHYGNTNGTAFPALALGASLLALPTGTVESLFEPENRDTLISVLTYHVVPAKVRFTGLSDGANAPTVQGETVAVNLSDGVKINGANVIKADIKTSNVINHVIDTVLLPPEPKT